MSTSERIMSLLKGGVSNITFGISPKNGFPFVQAQQAIRTATVEGNITNVAHQSCMPSIPEALEKLANSVEHIAELHTIPDPKSNLIVMPPGSEGGN